jgi:hypothetical protein
MTTTHLPSYYTQTPASVRYDRRLTYFEIVFYGEIVAATHLEGYCWASNNHFATLFDCCTSKISKAISNLMKYGYINVQFEKSEKRIFRKIYITDQNKSHDHVEKLKNKLQEKQDNAKNCTKYEQKKLSTAPSKNLPPCEKFTTPPSKNLLPPLVKIYYHNNKNIIYINNNNKIYSAICTENEQLTGHKELSKLEAIEFLFNCFYEKYPIKKSKTQAFKAFTKKIKNLTIENAIRFTEQITKALDDQAEERKIKAENKIWCPAHKLPSTWLNTESWEDEVCLDESKFTQQTASGGNNNDGLDYLFKDLTEQEQGEKVINVDDYYVSNACKDI